MYTAAVPRFVQRLRILEFTLDHEAPYFNNMRRRSSRKDSDLNGVVDVRYTGGARMLLLLEIGSGKWRLKVCPGGCCTSTAQAAAMVSGMWRPQGKGWWCTLSGCSRVVRAWSCWSSAACCCC